MPIPGVMRVRWGLGVAVAVMVTAAAACVPAEPPIDGASGGAAGPGTTGSAGPGRTGDANGALGACTVFPPDNAWNTDVSGAPLSANSANYLANILSSGGQFVHPDFGGAGEYGIPYVTVGAGEPQVPINFTAYGDESDPGPYPVPIGAPVEGGAASDGDRHVIAVDRNACKVYELYRAFPRGNHWDADQGSVFDLRSNALRPLGWTSADAAGLSIFAGLVRYDEVAAGHIDHALRFTISRSQRGYVLPATHAASSSTDPNRPPMGLRLRLKASFDRTRYTGQARVILDALAALRDDRRRQRLELVHHRRRRSAVERRRPEPAQGRPRLGLRGRRHRTGAPRLSAARPFVCAERQPCCSHARLSDDVPPSSRGNRA